MMHNDGFNFLFNHLYKTPANCHEISLINFRIFLIVFTAFLYIFGKENMSIFRNDHCAPPEHAQIFAILGQREGHGMDILQKKMIIFLKTKYFI